MPFGEIPPIKGAMFRLEDGVIVERFPFQYNPTEYSRTVSTGWKLSESLGQFLPVAVFSKFGERQVDFSLFMWGREKGAIEGSKDVDKQMDQLELFCLPGSAFSVDTPQNVSPGRTKLVMGRRVWNGIVESIRFRHSMFDKQLSTVMGTADVVFKVSSFGFQQDVEYINSVRWRAQNA